MPAPVIPSDTRWAANIEPKLEANRNKYLGRAGKRVLCSLSVTWLFDSEDHFTLPATAPETPASHVAEPGQAQPKEQQRSRLRNAGRGHEARGRQVADLEVVVVVGRADPRGEEQRGHRAADEADGEREVAGAIVDVLPAAEAEPSQAGKTAARQVEGLAVVPVQYDTSRSKTPYGSIVIEVGTSGVLNWKSTKLLTPTLST